MVVHRPLSPEEIKADSVLHDPADVDWSIPEQDQYEDIMGTTLDIYRRQARTGARTGLVVCGINNRDRMLLGQNREAGGHAGHSGHA